MNKTRLLIIGIGLIVIHAFTALLSHQFVFGQGHQDRPIVLFVSGMIIAGIIYWAAIDMIRRSGVNSSSSTMLLMIVIIAVLMRIPYAFSNLIQETDPYRYMWDGQTVLQGGNPYERSPQDAFYYDEKPYVHTPEVIDVYSKINHAGVKTIYPPLAQWLFALSQWISPWKLDAFRWMVGLADCAVMGFLIAILGRLNMSRVWVIGYAWSPLVVKEFSNSLHMDVFALLSLGWMMYALLRQWEIVAYVALLSAVLIKLFALVFLPVLIIWQMKFNRNNLFRNVSLFVALFIVSYIPFMKTGVVVTEGLGRFLTQWHTNAGLFSLIQWAVSLFAFTESTVALVSRLVSLFLFVVGSMVIMVRLHKSTTIESVFQSMLMIVALLFFLIPIGNPWYYTWVLLFLVFLPVRALIAFSILVFVYYLDFYFTYHGSRSTFVLVQWIEYGIFFICLGGELWSRQRPSLSRS